jgi:xylulokinase
MLADMFGKTCVSLECDEGPAYGAAILAGVGIGIWPDVRSACSKTIKIKKHIDPSGVEYMHSYDQYQKLYSQTRGWNPV